MTAPILKIIQGGPGRDALTAANSIKRALRTRDFRAVAFVSVDANGNVSTCFGGHEDGYFHQIRSGVETLRHRLSKWGDE
jgi:hypothetical protein